MARVEGTLHVIALENEVDKSNKRMGEGMKSRNFDGFDDSTAALKVPQLLCMINR